MMRSAASVVLVLACSAFANARLRGPQTELLAALSANPRFSEVNAAVRGGSPAEKVLGLLSSMEQRIADAQAEDHSQFVVLKDKCAGEAGHFAAVVKVHEARAQEVEQGIQEASATVESSHFEIASLVSRIADEQRGADRASVELGELEAAHASEVASFGKADDTFVEVLHAMDAIQAHLASAAALANQQQQQPVQAALIELGTTLERAQMHQHAAALRAAMGSEPQTVSSDVSVQIVDLVIALRRSIESHRTQNRELMDKSVAAYKEQRGKVEKRMEAHLRSRDLAKSTKEATEAAREQAVARRTALHEQLHTVKASVVDAQKGAHAAANVCFGYAHEYETRRHNRQHDLEALQAVRALIEEKQREIQSKLDELRHLSETATATGSAAAAEDESLHEMAARLDVQAPQVRNVEFEEYNAVEALRDAMDHQEAAKEDIQDAQAQLDALISESAETAQEAPAAHTGSTGIAFGGDF